MTAWGKKVQRTQTVFRGDRMRDLRNARGWSQAYMAEYCHVSRPQMANLENGVGEPSLKVLTLAASILATSTDYLLDMTSDPGSQYEMAKVVVERVEKKIVLDERLVMTVKEDT